MEELTDDQRSQILDAIRSHQKIEAIKLYREWTGLGLKESKDFIEALTDRLVKDDPTFMSATSSNKANQTKGAGCGSAALLFVTIVFVVSRLVLV